MNKLLYRLMFVTHDLTYRVLFGALVIIYKTLEVIDEDRTNEILRKFYTLTD